MNKLESRNVLFFYMQIFICFSLIGCAYFLTFKISYYFYPVSFILIVNTFIRLFSLGHDGTHGSLANNQKLNDIFSRYLCYAPILFSFNRYRSLHNKHHKYLGSKYDPDIVLDTNTPRSNTKYFLYIMKRILTLNTFIFALKAYTDIFRIGNQNKRDLKDYKIDTLNVLAFWVFLVAIFILNNLFTEFVVLWLIPLYFLPLVIELFSLLHHRVGGDLSGLYSRNIITNRFIEELIFPAGIAFHGLHHDYPTVPWHNLRKLKHDPEKKDQFQSFGEALKNLAH